MVRREGQAKMPTSATGSNQDGFTLIELMVVVTIIALASAVVVFAIPDPRGRVIDEAERFAARTLAARDDAIVERRRRGAWQTMTEKPFKAAVWQPGTSVEIGADGRQAIAFDATGAPSSPATVILMRDNARATVTVSGNGVIRVGS